MHLLARWCVLWVVTALSAALVYNDGTVGVPGCKNVESSHHRYVYFMEPSEPQRTLAIVTKWKYYAQDLRSMIPAEGFKLVNAPDPKASPDACRWTHLDLVSKDGIDRGDIIFRDQTGGPGKRQEPGPPEAGSTNSPSMPSIRTLRRARSILLRNSPTRDIVKIVLMVVGPIIGTGIVLAVAYVLSLYLYPNTDDDGRDEEDIELPRVRVTTSDLTLTELPAAVSTKHKDPFASEGYGKEYDQDVMHVYRNDSAVQLQLGETYSISNYSS